MRRDALQGARDIVLGIAVSLMAVVFIYVGLVELTRNVYIYFKGYAPGANVWAVRAVFYTLAAVGVFAVFFLKKRFFSRESLAPLKDDEDECLHYLMGRSAYVLLLAEAPVNAGFLMYFVSLLNWDFYIMAAASLVLIYINIPTVGYWEERLRQASSTRGRPS